MYLTLHMVFFSFFFLKREKLYGSNDSSEAFFYCYLAYNRTERQGLNNGGFPGVSEVNNLPANAGNTVLIPGLGRSPGRGSGNQLQHSCLRNPKDRGAWWAIVHRVAKSWILLSYWTTTAAATQDMNTANWFTGVIFEG